MRQIGLAGALLGIAVFFPVHASALEPSGTISCKGSQDLNLAGKHITGRAGLVVKGNCTLTIANSKIDAAGVGIRVTGNGTVNVKNCEVTGGKLAVRVSKNGTVNAWNSKFSGRIKKEGNGDFHKKGGKTTIEKRPARRYPKGLKKARPVNCRGNQDITLTRRLIETSGVGVVARGACDVTLVDCYIIAGGVAVEAKGSGDIHIRNSHIEGKEAAVFVHGAGDVHARGSTFVGKIVKRGNGDFNKKGGNTFRKK